MSENPDSPDLVQPEGVNAGSAATTDGPVPASPQTGSTPPHGDGLRGDGPDTVPEQAAVEQDSHGEDDAGEDDAGEDDGALLGAPGTDPRSTGQYAAESGQDSGSMS